MTEIAVFKEDFMEHKRTEYRSFVRVISTNNGFEDDVWVCDKMKRNNADKVGAYSIYFSGIPECFKEVAKYFIVVKLIAKINILTARMHMVRLRWLFQYASKNNITDLVNFRDYTLSYQFKKHLDENCPNEEQKHGIWASVGNFFKVMNNFYDTADKTSFCDNPYTRALKHDYKLVPEAILTKIDYAFMESSVSLHIRVAYWILRLFPSRVQEVCAISIDCLKKFNGDWVMFVPTWKQSGGYKEPEIRRLYFKDTGMGKYLADIIREQQAASLKLQKFLPKEQSGLLLTYQKEWYRYGKWHKNEIGPYSVLTATPTHINVFFAIYCKIYNILDDNGKQYIVKSHQLRHNGITERLCEGFTPEQIMHMTAHKNDSMIINSYSHFDLKPDIMLQKQQAIIGESENMNDAVMFGGRILNMNVDVENRLLANPRSQRVRGGICSDITGCRCDMYLCLSCKCFIPEVEQLAFFESQEKSWREKAERFTAFPIIVKNALENATLYDLIVSKIKQQEGLSR